MVGDDRIGSHTAYITVGSAPLIEIHHHPYRHPHINAQIHIFLHGKKLFLALLQNIDLIQMVPADQHFQIFQTSQIFSCISF